MNRDQIREVFLAHGFTVKPGNDDLKPYVYEAAEALLALAATEAAEPVALTVPEIDYAALIHAAYAHPSVKAAQGTPKCVAFARGAEWFRSQCVAAPTDSEAGRDAVEAAAERAIEHALKKAGVLSSLGGALAVDAGMTLFQKFSRTALSTPTGRAAE